MYAECNELGGGAQLVVLLHDASSGRELKRVPLCALHGAGALDDVEAIAESDDITIFMQMDASSSTSDLCSTRLRAVLHLSIS